MPDRPQLCAACGAALSVALADACDACGKSPLLQGRYLLVEVVGRGAAGITYRAVEAESGRQVAVKEMPYRRAASMKALELFHREAEVLRQLTHPGVVAYLDHFEAGEGKGRALYLVQEYLDGQTLAEELKTRRYTELEVMQVVDQLLGILAYLHNLAPPVIHRDLKPENIMRREDGSLVLIDFGAVRDAVKDAEVGGSTVAGTFGYMAPEQFRGVARPATDLYAVGATAVALLTREEPHQLLGPTGQLDWERNVRVSRATRSLLSSMLAADIDDRAQSAAILRDRLARGSSGKEPNESPPSRGQRRQERRSGRERARARRRAAREARRAKREALRAGRRAGSVDGRKRRGTLVGLAVGIFVVLGVFIHVPWPILVGGILAIFFGPRLFARFKASAEGSATKAPAHASEDEAQWPMESEEDEWELTESEDADDRVSSGAVLPVSTQVEFDDAAFDEDFEGHADEVEVASVGRRRSS